MDIIQVTYLSTPFTFLLKADLYIFYIMNMAYKEKKALKDVHNNQLESINGALRICYN